MATTTEQAVHFDEYGGNGYPADLYHFDTLAQGVEGFGAVGPEQLAFFEQFGYLVVHHAFSQAQVDAALDALLDLIDGKYPDFTGVQFEAYARQRLAELPREQKQDYVRKLFNFGSVDPRLEAIAEDGQLRTILRGMLGDGVARSQDMAMLKPPGGGREKPWHQDKAFFNFPITTPIVGVWIALDAATPENGCMHVIPGSHREGPVIHFQRRDWQICDTEVQRDRDVVVPLAPGGLLFFDGLIHHGTPANQTKLRRRALQFHYRAASAVATTREARMEVFGSEGKDVTC
jgi:phytanoyl-CoA hydroxylase